MFTVSCESHTREVPFHVVAGLLRTVFGISDLDERGGRARVRAASPTPTRRTCCCWTTYSESATPTPRRPYHPRCPPAPVGGLVNAAALTRTAPALYVIEDVHWIDEVSEAMLADSSRWCRNAGHWC